MTTNDKSDDWWKNLLRACGFGSFQWFRRWYGGTWVLECDFRTFVSRQAHYPDSFIGEGFRWILAVERYPIPKTRKS